MRHYAELIESADRVQADIAARSNAYARSTLTVYDHGLQQDVTARHGMEVLAKFAREASWSLPDPEVAKAEDIEMLLRHVAELGGGVSMRLTLHTGRVIQA